MGAQKRPAFRLRGLKFHIEIEDLEFDAGGEDAGVPQLKGMVAEKVAHAIQPVMRGLLPGDAAPPAAAAVVPVTTEKRPRRPRAPRAANAQPSESVALAWKPKSNPHLGWSSGKKALWLIHFHSKENGGTESAPKGLTIPVVVATYNKHFPHAKPIQSSHVYRDLNNYAAANPALVTTDRNLTPPVWYVAPAGAAVVDEMLRSMATPLIPPSAA